MVNVLILKAIVAALYPLRILAQLIGTQEHFAVLIVNLLELESGVGEHKLAGLKVHGIELLTLPQIPLTQVFKGLGRFEEALLSIQHVKAAGTGYTVAHTLYAAYLFTLASIFIL